MAYEGLEQSPNIVYTGAAPNQQIIPAVKWCYDHLKARKFFLVGSDYVWPHGVNEIVKDQLKALGAEVVGEEYILFGSADVDAVIAEIKEAKPDVILSTVVGDTNVPFYRELRGGGLGPSGLPVISFSIAEDELRKLPGGTWSATTRPGTTSRAIDRAENREFVRKFKARYGADRVTSDAIVAAYNSVRLWAQAVEEAETDDVADVIKAIAPPEPERPRGDHLGRRETQHTWRPVFLGKVRGDGQFDIVWSSEKPIRPSRIPSRGPRRSGSLLDELHRAWGGWANPGRPRSRPAEAAGSVACPRPRPPRSLRRGLVDRQAAGSAAELDREPSRQSDFPIDRGAFQLMNLATRASGSDWLRISDHDPVAALVPGHLADPVRGADGADARSCSAGRWRRRCGRGCWRSPTPRRPSSRLHPRAPGRPDIAEPVRHS